MSERVEFMVTQFKEKTAKALTGVRQTIHRAKHIDFATEIGHVYAGELGGGVCSACLLFIGIIVCVCTYIEMLTNIYALHSTDKYALAEYCATMSQRIVLGLFEGIGLTNAQLLGAKEMAKTGV
jgi:hypothetical protein